MAPTLDIPVLFDSVKPVVKSRKPNTLIGFVNKELKLNISAHDWNQIRFNAFLLIR